MHLINPKWGTVYRIPATMRYAFDTLSPTKYIRTVHSLWFVAWNEHPSSNPICSYKPVPFLSGEPNRSLQARKHRSPSCGQYAQYAKPPSRLTILSEELQIRHLPSSAKDLSEMFFRCVVRHLGGSSTWQRSGRKPSPKDNMTASSPRLLLDTLQICVCSLHVAIKYIYIESHI